jgi:hypothetical protein
MEQTEQIKSKEIYKKIYRSAQVGVMMLTKAKQQGRITQIKHGVYLFDDKMKQWIEDCNNGIFTSTIKPTKGLGKGSPGVKRKKDEV